MVYHTLRGRFVGIKINADQIYRPNANECHTSWSKVYKELKPGFLGDSVKTAELALGFMENYTVALHARKDRIDKDFSGLLRRLKGSFNTAC